jgi:enamine deaminase RidA (YjgF/YER057c/UK114 family)
MKTWHDALTKVHARLKRFEVRVHRSDIASDYFILHPHNDKPARAVVGFPKMEGEGMRGGLAITNSLLAKDLDLNWDRLWQGAK